MRALSQRLQFITSQLLEGHDVWDLCCDHGLIGRWAVKADRFPSVQFVDPVPSIIERLRLTLEKHAFEGRWTLHTVEAQSLPDMSGTVVIAGVGGELIQKILEAHQDRCATVQKWILGPHKDEQDLLNWLKTWKSEEFKISEDSVEEKGRRRPFFLLNRI